MTNSFYLKIEKHNIKVYVFKRVAMPETRIETLHIVCQFLVFDPVPSTQIPDQIYEDFVIVFWARFPFPRFSIKDFNN